MWRIPPAPAHCSSSCNWPPAWTKIDSPPPCVKCVCASLRGQGHGVGPVAVGVPEFSASVIWDRFAQMEGWGQTGKDFHYMGQDSNFCVPFRLSLNSTQKSHSIELRKPFHQIQFSGLIQLPVLQLAGRSFQLQSNTG